MAEGQRVDPFGAFVATMEDNFIATLASSFLDKSPQCLAYFGLDQLCRFANPNFCRVFGLDPTAAGLGQLWPGSWGRWPATASARWKPR